MKTPLGSLVASLYWELDNWSLSLLLLLDLSVPISSIKHGNLLGCFLWMRLGGSVLQVLVLPREASQESSSCELLFDALICGLYISSEFCYIPYTI